MTIKDRSNDLVLALLFAGVAASSAVFAEEPEPKTLPPVEAVVPFMPFCTGVICEGLRQSMDILDWDAATQDLFAEGGGSMLTKEQFCAEMKQKAPEDCDINNPPSTPGYDTEWVSNGCGDGKFTTFIGAQLGRLVLRDFTGNLDNPLPGISFLGACRFHDSCYSTTVDKSTCDRTFLSQMENACGAGSSTYANECQDVAAAYYGAVGVDGGDAYSDAQQARECAAWVADMEANGCE